MILKNTTINATSLETATPSQHNAWHPGRYAIELVVLLHLIPISYAIYKMCQSIRTAPVDDPKGVLLNRGRINVENVFKMRNIKRMLRDVTRS